MTNRPLPPAEACARRVALDRDSKTAIAGLRHAERVSARERVMAATVTAPPVSALTGTDYAGAKKTALTMLRRTS